MSSLCTCGNDNGKEGEPAIPQLLLNRRRQKPGILRLGGPLPRDRQTQRSKNNLNRSYQIPTPTQQRSKQKVIVYNQLNSSRKRIEQLNTSSLPESPRRSEQERQATQVSHNAYNAHNAHNAQNLPTRRRESMNLQPRLKIGSEKDNVRKYNNEEHSDVKMRLDRNLQQIYNQLKARKREAGGGRVEVNELEKRLVAEYINLVYEEYNIPDPMRQQHTEPSTLSQTQHQAHHHRVETSNSNTSHTNRKAVQLKQSFIIDMFSPSENRYPDSPYTKTDRENTKEYTYSSKRNTHSNNDRVKLQQIEEYENEEVKDSYRYCFICEEPILEANIRMHQRDKCPEFSTLYSLSLEELSETLHRKVRKLQKQVENYLKKLLTKEQQCSLVQDFERVNERAWKYLEILRMSSHEKAISKAEIKQKFNLVMQSYEIDYFRLYESLRKLQWFALMLKNLEEKYGGQKGREEGRRFSLGF